MQTFRAKDRFVWRCSTHHGPDKFEHIGLFFDEPIQKTSTVSGSTEAPTSARAKQLEFGTELSKAIGVKPHFPRALRLPLRWTEAD